MSVPTTCSWCRTVNDSSARWCKTCGHSAWLARGDCDCRQCLGVLFGGEMTVIMPPPGDPIAERLQKIVEANLEEGQQ